MSIADKLTLLASTKEALRIKLGLSKNLPFSEYYKYALTHPDTPILALFKDGKQGVWYDPSDKSTLFQDVAGTVLVTKDGDPVALMLDKSGNGNHAMQSVSAARPVYRTDGILHWIAGDGIDDFFETTKMPSIPRDATGMYLCLAANQSAAIIKGVAPAFRVGQYNTSSARTFSTNTAPNTNLYVKYSFGVQDKTSYQAYYETSTDTPSVSHLMTGKWGGAGRKSKSRINKGSWAEATQALASCGNLVSQSLLIFKGHADGVAVGGSLFGMVIISSDLTDSDADAVSSYLAAKAGVML